VSFCRPCRKSISVRPGNVARQHSRGLDIVSEATTEGGSERTEVILTVSGYHSEPCRFVLNVSRVSSVEFHHNFAQQLNDALHKHNAA
jgi:hypothetical protein